MARIPSVQDMGPRPIPQGQLPIVTDQSGDIKGQALEDFGTNAIRISDQIVNMARAQASNALLDHEIAVKGTVESVKKRVESGEIPYDKAESTFQQEVSAIKVPQIGNLDRIGAQSFTRGLQRNTLSGQLAVRGVADAAQKIDFRDQFSTNLDRLGKLAGMPGADIEKINAQADMFAPLAMRAGIPKNTVDQAIQGFKDQNWFNQANMRSAVSRDSLDELKKLEHDLTASDGFYVGKLDSDKRAAVMNTVIGHRIQLQNRLDHEADKREAQAERAVNEIDRQISSTVPATAEQWSEWELKTKGTTFEPLFKEAQKNEREVQAIVRQPIDQQIKYVQDQQADLMKNGGSIRDAANVQRLATAVQKNVQLLQTDPLQFNAERTGVEVVPLEAAKLAGDDAAVSQQLKSRIDSLNAMRAKYGSQVPMRPLLPQEAAQLSSAVKSMTPRDAASLYASLYKLAGTPDAYQGMMQQIAKDSPVQAHAGMLAAEQAELTTKSHWFKPDDTVTNSDVAGTMLEGERLINPPKEQKQEDGKPKLSLFLPEQRSLQDEFASVVGAAFSDSPEAAEHAFQAVKAYYVGRAEQLGQISQGTAAHADPKLVEEAVKATLGNVVNYNGRGEVIAPWGMSKSGFNDRVPLAFADALKKHGMAPENIETLSSLGLRNYGDGTYQLVQGKNVFTDPQGRAIILDLNHPFTTFVEKSRGRAGGGGTYRVPVVQ